ncbi:MAG: DNA-directed RNA polymerase subunit omega [Alkalispirochaetaceae bacterium]
MPIPLDLLISESANMYEITCASIRRARQLADIQRVYDDGQETEEGEKVVSEAIREILTRDVQYQIEE